ncbi:glycosyltransferase, partial [Muribaculum intestinale]
DCFPLVLLEAMQAHLPIISTDEGGITDIITDKITGLITNKHDAHSLANNIATLLDSPELRTKLGEAAYKDFLTRFTIRKFEERIEELLIM